jgi:hypothetical protein
MTSLDIQFPPHTILVQVEQCTSTLYLYFSTSMRNCTVTRTLPLGTSVCVCVGVGVNSPPAPRDWGLLYTAPPPPEEVQ